MDSSSQSCVPGALFNQRNKENNASVETENNIYRFPVTVMTDYRYHSQSPFYGAGYGNSTGTNDDQSQGSQFWAQQRLTFDREIKQEEENEHELESDLSDGESEIVDSLSATVSEKREKKKKVVPQKSAPKEVDWSTEDVERLINLWREKEELYMVNHQKYYDRAHRSLLLTDIADELKVTIFSIY